MCDTSGRLHTNWNLMEELAGCKRAIDKRVEGGPQEVLLVLDGTTGTLMYKHTCTYIAPGTMLCIRNAA